jgi:ATP-binding cassette, subfamily B, multidrug efflux pump
MDKSNRQESFFREVLHLKRLWPFIRTDQWILWVALLVTPLISMFALAQPYLIKVAIDDHFSKGDFTGLSEVAWMYLGVALCSYVLSVGYALGLSWAGMRMLVRLREWLYERVLSLPLSFFDKRPAGVLLTRLTNDIDALGEVIGAGIVTIALDILMVIGCLGAMLYLDVELTILMLMCSPILIGLIELVRRRLKNLYLTIRDSIASVNAYLSEQIDGVEIIQLFGGEDRSEAQFDVRNLKFRNASMESNIYDSLMFALVDGLSSVFIAMLLWYGSGQMGEWLGFEGIQVQSAGLMVAFIDYLNRLLTPVRDLSQKMSVIQRALAAVSKIFGLVDEQEPMNLDGVGVPPSNGHIQLSNLRFAYSEEADDVIKGIDLEIQPGQVVAIVGSSGSGKTTLTRILDRSYIGYRGSITLDGVELSTCSIPSLRKQVVAVRQDLQIFSRSLRFNVLLENPDVSMEQAQKAAELTCADGFIERLGWDKVLRERGGDLSVGEGQLLTFARTMAIDANIVILDEATASVDSVTEGKIQQAIENIFIHKTVIVIAHRLSTIQQADSIVVLEKGQVVEQGSHSELLTLNGRYAELVEAGKAAVG